MIWPFSRKKSLRPVKKLPFKSNEGFFEFYCKYGQTEIRSGEGIVALVVDSKKEFGASQSTKIRAGEIQTVAMKVASKDGGFLGFAQTASGRGDRLYAGDLVIWTPMTHLKESVADGMDERSRWIGLIVAKIEPVIDLTNHQFEIISDYT